MAKSTLGRGSFHRCLAQIALDLRVFTSFFMAEAHPHPFSYDSKNLGDIRICRTPDKKRVAFLVSEVCRLLTSVHVGLDLPTPGLQAVEPMVLRRKFTRVHQKTHAAQ